MALLKGSTVSSFFSIYIIFILRLVFIFSICFLKYFLSVSLFLFFFTHKIHSKLFYYVNIHPVAKKKMSHDDESWYLI